MVTADKILLLEISPRKFFENFKLLAKSLKENTATYCKQKLLTYSIPNEHNKKIIPKKFPKKITKICIIYDNSDLFANIILKFLALIKLFEAQHFRREK